VGLAYLVVNFLLSKNTPKIEEMGQGDVLRVIEEKLKVG